MSHSEPPSSDPNEPNLARSSSPSGESSLSPPSHPPAESELRHAFDSVVAEISGPSALPPVRVNLSPSVVLKRLLPAIPRIRSFRDQIQRALPEFDLAHLDKLETYALAFAFAQGIARATPRTAARSTLAWRQAVALRKRVAECVTPLQNRGLLPVNARAKRRNSVSCQGLARDLSGLAMLLTKHWAIVEKRTPLTREDLAETLSMSEQLMGRKAADDTVRASKDLAQRHAAGTFALFVRAYEQVLRAITYLRWDDGDCHDIVPTLYPRARRKGSKAAIGRSKGKPRRPG